ncbi:MAG: hypothetical protein IPH30_08830 [Betaproteobacteria bacterium]|nr:hypothetical protein [Betaproteobacteria bacterium]
MVLAIVVAWLFTRFLLYPQLGVPDNAPMLLRPVAGFLLAWYLLHAAGGAGRRWAWHVRETSRSRSSSPSRCTR